MNAANNAFENGQFKRALVLYSESAIRFADTDPQAARTAEGRAYKSLEEVLQGAGFSVVAFDPQQNKEVLSEDAVKALKNLQSKNRLSVSGQLDAPTLRIISGEMIFPHIKTAYEKAKETP
jgi:hypothetical protein